MRHCLSNVFAAVSLVLCLATAGLWAGSYRGYSGIATEHHSPDGIWSDGPTTWFVYRGRLGMIHALNPGMNSVETFAEPGRRWTLLGEESLISGEARIRADSWPGNAHQYQSDWDLAGFSLATDVDYLHVLIPIWSVVLLFAIVPAVLLRKLVRRFPAGRCPNTT